MTEEEADLLASSMTNQSIAAQIEPDYDKIKEARDNPQEKGEISDDEQLYIAVLKEAASRLRNQVSDGIPTT